MSSPRAQIRDALFSGGEDAARMIGRRLKVKDATVNAYIAHFNKGAKSELPEWVGDDAGDHDDKEETEEQASARILLRYRALERMTQRIVDGTIPSLIVSGPPGIGKSFTVRKAMKTLTAPKIAQFVSGAASAVGLYKALYNTRENGVLILDDCDDVFWDDTALNLLKAALDSDMEYRTISWLKEAAWLQKEELPEQFEFRGSIVFLTNIDFERMIESGRPGAEHFKALIDRSMYLCLTLRTRRDFMIRIRQVACGDDGMLRSDRFPWKLAKKQEDEVISFIDKNKERFYNLSLRLVGQVATCLKADPKGWQEDVEATKMKTL